MGIGTFGSFTQARLAIYAAQTGLTVTGNNISNINTEGYTRQRLNQVSLYTAGSDRYYARGDIRIGQGALVKSISQIRSPYLDIRFREANAQVGYLDGRLDGLNNIASILDEVGKGDESKDEDGYGILGLEFHKIFDALEQLVDQTGHQEYDNIVRQTVGNLVSKFHSYASQLQTLYDNTVTSLHQNVDKVNGILTSIRSLNEEIRKCEVHGDNALELRDERNNLIDKLSELVDINVTYSEEEISPGLTVEKLTIRLGDANPDGSVETDESLLVDGIYCGKLILEQVPQERDPKELEALRKENPDDLTLWPYLDAAGKGTLSPYVDAAGKGTDWPYTDKDGKGTEWAFVDAKGQGTEWAFTDANGEGTNDPLAADGVTPNTPNTPNKANTANTENAAFERYLKPDGKPTADESEARKVDNSNFNIKLGKLKDKIGQVHTSIVKGIVEAAAANGATAQKDPAGAAMTVEDLFKGLKSNSVSVEEADVPEAGDTTITIYTRIRSMKDGKPETDANGDPVYRYEKQVFQQIASKVVELDDNDLGGRIQAQRELLTEKGEFVDQAVIHTKDDTGPSRIGDENAGSKRGIQYYQRALDLLANQLAKVFNDANQGYRVNGDGNYITKGTNDKGEEIGIPITLTGKNVDGSDAIGTDHQPMTFQINKNDTWSKMNPFLQQALKIEVGMKADDPVSNEVGEQIVNAFLKGQSYDAATESFVDVDGVPPRGIFDGGVLISNDNASDDCSNITASNINISATWSVSSILVRSFTCLDEKTEPVSGQSDNINHLKYMFDSAKLDFIPSDLEATKDASDEIMFNGTLFEMWNQIGSTLGNDQTETGSQLDTFYGTALEIDTSRDSVSAVDFNDEAMNLMMYAKSYNAACRLMTTIDSVLDKLINNTGLTT